MDELEEWSTTLPTAEVQAIFDRHGVPSSPYRTVKEAMADPQLAHRRSLTEVHDKGGTFLALNPPFRMTASRAAAEPHVAALGADSAAVLAEAGYSAAEIAALAEAGVTVTA
jgi:crotonobetainyl-CoA:carnitine CoA-transferase CaiB-like acyl-CoA transferase